MYALLQYDLSQYMYHSEVPYRSNANNTVSFLSVKKCKLNITIWENLNKKSEISKEEKHMKQRWNEHLNSI